MGATNLVIGLGPGFTAGEDCHAVIETRRGPFLGRVIWNGAAEKNTGIPESVMGFGKERVLRAPVAGIFYSDRQIGEFVEAGEELGKVNSVPVKAFFSGMIRGLIRTPIKVIQDMKLGDLDPRKDPRLT